MLCSCGRDRASVSFGGAARQPDVAPRGVNASCASRPDAAAWRRLVAAHAGDDGGRMPPAAVRAPASIGPAAATLRAEMVAGRTRAAVVHRMTAAARAAPPSRAAAFRDRDDQAVGGA